MSAEIGGKDNKKNEYAGTCPRFFLAGRPVVKFFRRLLSRLQNFRYLCAEYNTA
jgi:hypothetical protein